MIQTNEAWNRIALDPYHRTTFQLIVDGHEIPPNRIAAAPEITTAFYTDRWSVGNIASSCLTVTYLPDSDDERPKKAAKTQMRCVIWPRDGDWILSDEFDRSIVTESGEDIWLMDTQAITLGTWYINTRATDAHGWVTLACYDKLLRLDKYTVKKAAKKYGVKLTYPVDMEQIIYLAEKVTGLTGPPLEDACGLEFSKDDVTELTMREALGYVATVNGANIRADETGKSMVSVLYKSYLYDGPYLETEDGDELSDENGECIFFYDEDSAAMFLDLSCMSDLSLSDTPWVVAAVKVSGPDDDAIWTATPEESPSSGGTTYEVDWPLSCGSQQVANQMIDALGWFQYTPWDARNVLLDPKIQVGDIVVVNGVETVLSDMTATCGGAYIVDCGAAGEAEPDEEL